LSSVIVSTFFTGDIFFIGEGLRAVVLGRAGDFDGDFLGRPLLLFSDSALAGDLLVFTGDLPRRAGDLDLAGDFPLEGDFGFLAGDFPRAGLFAGRAGDLDLGVVFLLLPGDLEDALVFLSMSGRNFNNTHK